MQSKQSLPIKVKPYKHQQDAVEFATKILGYNGEQAKSKSVAILAEMGTGKSLITIALAGKLWEEKQIRRMLVVAPLSITGVWKEEFEKFADYNFRLTVLEGTTAEKIRKLQCLDAALDVLQVAVINYESAWRMEGELAFWRPNLIVCDESSKIKNPNAKQSKALHRLGRVAKHNVILTGTPVTNNPLDFYSQYKFLDEKIFGSSFYVFRAKYAILGGYGCHQIVGYKNLDELTKKAHEIAYRITKAEALDLPEQVDTTRYIQLESRADAIYRMVEKESVAELESGEITATNVLTKLLRLSQITGGFLRSDADEKAEEISHAKMDVLEEILEECLDSGKKLVVFARFIPEIDAIERMLKAKGVGYALIKGEVKDRAEQVEKFQKDPRIKVFIGQLQTTGMGLTLTAADTAVFYSLSYNFADYEQAKARIHRIGQKNNCTYIHLIAKGTIDERVMDALKNKKNIADLVVDNWKSLFKKGAKYE